MTILEAFQRIIELVLQNPLPSLAALSILVIFALTYFHIPKGSKYTTAIIFFVIPIILLIFSRATSQNATYAPSQVNVTKAIIVTSPFESCSIQGKFSRYCPPKIGRDRNNITGEFSIIILADQYEWEIGRSDKLVKSNSIDKAIKLDILKEDLREQGIQNILKKSSDVIAVGTASCQSREGTLREEQRAMERAQTIKRLLVNAFPEQGNIKNLFSLNVGKYKDDKCPYDSEGIKSTSPQRKVMIVCVTNKQSNDLNLTQALYGRLKQYPVPGFDLDDYTLGSDEILKLFN